MAKIYVCDFCGGRLGETALGSTKGGQYCSVECKRGKSKTHVINGVTYVEVDRKAEVGDIVYYDSSKRICKVIPSEERLGHGRWDTTSEYIAQKSNAVKVLVPIEPLESEEVTVDTSQASEQVIEMLANLARRVTSLERQLADTQRNDERQAEELENAKHFASKALRVTADHGGWLIRNAERLDKAEENIEMLTGDVITLDERTQVINAITKFYGGERR